jgi:hypothetical protein
MGIESTHYNGTLITIKQMNKEQYLIVFARARTKVLNAIEASLNINFDKLSGKKREREIVDARHLYSYFMRQYGFSLNTIAQSINRDHASVLFGIRKVENLVAIDNVFKQKFDSVEELIGVDLNSKITEESLVQALNIQLLSLINPKNKAQAERIVDNIIKTSLSRYGITEEANAPQENIEIKDTLYNFDEVKNILKEQYGWEKIDTYPENYLNNLKQVSEATIKSIQK